MQRIVLHGPTPETMIRLHFVRHARLLEWRLNQMAAPFWRCYCPLEPGGSILFVGQAYALCPGDVMLIPPDTPCASTNTHPFRKLYGHFSCVIGRCSVAPGVYVTRLPDFEAEALKQLEAGTPSGRDLDLRLNFLVLRAITLGLGAMPPGVLTSVASSDSRVEGAIALMQECCREPLDNTALAQALDMHPNSFVRLFTQQTGTAPQRYYRRLRLEQACRLLIETVQSIEQVAENCGFWDRNHFTRAFTRQWHCPPAEWRRRNQ